MGNTIDQAGKAEDRILKVDIVHCGEKMILPENVTINEAIDVLMRRKKHLQEVVRVQQTFDVSPLDGAHALNAVISNKYGWTEVGPTPGFWGPTPPLLIAVETAPGVFVNVPWGVFTLPGISGELRIGHKVKNGRVQFIVMAEIKRESEDEINTLFKALNEYLKTGSIYRGKAVRVRFNDDKGETLAMPQITFIDTAVDESMLIYSRDVQNSIHTNLFTPIQRLHDLEANGIPFKRGVLLGGVFGTGKTLAAKVASKFAVQAGLTYVYAPRADELKSAIEFARQYQNPGAVIFCEDVDRVTTGERSVAMDDLLNIIDGIDGKNDRIMVVLTTNELNNVHPAMLRPGRLDAVIEITAPDEEAVQRLLRAYGGSTIADTADLGEAADILKGQIPATIAEVVKRAKLAQIGLQKPGEPVSLLSGASLAIAATTMTGQLSLLNKDRNPPRDPSFRELISGVVSDVVSDVVKPLRLEIGKIAEAVIDE